MPQCQSNLPNLGKGDCKLSMTTVRRFLFTSKYKEDGTENRILKTDAITLANWQTLFDKPAFSTSKLEKVVPSPWMQLPVFTPSDPEVYDEDGNYQKIKDGNKDVTAELQGVVPALVGAFKGMEQQTISIYMLDDESQVWGEDDGLYIKPLEITGLNVDDFNPRSYNDISREVVRFRFKYPNKLNSLIEAVIASSNAEDDNDFYSLIDSDQVITSPAITGCQTVIDTDRYAEAVTGITYTAFNFVDQADSSSTTLAGAGSLTESPDGTYVVNEAALLTTGHTYDLQITFSGYDIATQEVVVP